MAARKSLAGNVMRAPQAEVTKAAELARELGGQDADEGDEPYETVSVTLPESMVDLIRALAEERHRLDIKEKRKARRRGEKPGQARRSASQVVRECIETAKPRLQAELSTLRGQ